MQSTIRNIGIIAHIDAGKTTLTERILLAVGRIHKAGDIKSGSATMDWRALEKKHGITISAAATTCEWRGNSINVIDTPGHADFTVEVERSLRVLDSAVAVFSGVSGVEPQSEIVWRQASKFGVSRLVFVNKMDLTGADFARTVSAIETQLGAETLVLQMPIGAEGTFRGVVDLIGMRALVWPSPDSADYVVEDIPADLAEAAQAARKRLIERLATLEDWAIERFLAEGSFSDEELRGLVRTGCLRGLAPVLCGSAFRHIGVQPLLDAVVDYAPSPTDLPATEGVHPATGAPEKRDADVGAPASGLAFKLQSTEHGVLNFVRVYSGLLEKGTPLWNPRTGTTERVGRLVRMHANEQSEVASARAGDIVALVGLKGAIAGDTLCAPGAPILFGALSPPEPVIEAVIEPVLASDHQRMGQALAKITRDDPSIRFGTDPETGQTLVRGMGELHLDVAVVEALAEEHKVDVRLGQPRVAYREAATKVAEIDHTLRKQDGGSGQFARIKLRFEPLPDGETGLVFENRTVGGSVPKEFVPAVENGLRTAMDGGCFGYPVVGLRAVLVDGGTHVNDSSAMAFEIAARQAFRAGFARTEPVVLEPVMALEVTTPSDHVGALVGDLNARGGTVTSLDAEELSHVITAEAPLANLFRYVNAVRSLSRGRAGFSMQFARYAPAQDQAALKAG